MPDMNGVELATAIGQLRPDLPIILATGHGQIDALKGFEDRPVLQKAWTESEVVEKIALALS